MDYEYLTYEETLSACKKFYPEHFLGGQDVVDAFCRVQKKLQSLSRCDDLSDEEQWKVRVLLPNVEECLT